MDVNKIVTQDEAVGAELLQAKIAGFKRIPEVRSKEGEGWKSSKTRHRLQSATYELGEEAYSTALIGKQLASIHLLYKCVQ
jgi:hypothetical protein